MDDVTGVLYPLSRTNDPAAEYLLGTLENEDRVILGTPLPPTAARTRPGPHCTHTINRSWMAVPVSTLPGFPRLTRLSAAADPVPPAAPTKPHAIHPEGEPRSSGCQRGLPCRPGRAGHSGGGELAGTLHAFFCQSAPAPRPASHPGTGQLRGTLRMGPISTLPAARWSGEMNGHGGWRRTPGSLG